MLSYEDKWRGDFAACLAVFMSMNYERVSLQMIARMVKLTKTGIFIIILPNLICLWR